MASPGFLSKTIMKQIERERMRIGGARIVTDDINKLKGLTTDPEIPEADKINSYREAVTIEYYIPKESRFAYEVKNLYIPLHDPIPKNDDQRRVAEYFLEKKKPIDMVEVMNVFPQYLATILQYFNPIMHIHEFLSRELQTGLNDDLPSSVRRAMYLTEVLRKYEPTLPSLELVGDYTTFNLNWFVRYFNERSIEISLEDPTVEYLIKHHLHAMEQLGQRETERFYILKDIYLEQAFSNIEEDFADEFV